MSKKKILLFETFQTLAGLGFSVNIMRQTAGELPANPDPLPDGRIPAAYVIADDEIHIWNESGSEWVKTDLIQARSFGSILGDPSDNTNLQTALDGKVENWGDIGGTLSTQTDLQTALDGKADKDVGSWNPTLKIGGAEVSYSLRRGRYIELDKFVYVEARIDVSSKNGLTGGMTIGGFPFPSNNTDAGASIRIVENFADMNSLPQITLGIEGGVFQLGETDRSILTDANIQDNFSIRFSGGYERV